MDLEGLLNIINEIENGSIPKSVKIIGTSYFFNKRTLNKFGFELKNPSLFYRINLLANFMDLIWMYSISQGRFSIPKIWTANKASIEGGDLVVKKNIIKELYRKLTIKKNDRITVHWQKQGLDNQHFGCGSLSASVPADVINLAYCC